MEKMKAKNTRRKMKRKILLLIVSVILMAVMFVLQMKDREKDRRDYQKAVKEEEENERKTEKKESPDKKETSGEAKRANVRISNLEEYALPLMEENAKLLEERLVGWIEENQLTADRGEIFHILIPETDPQSINFYLELNDKRSSLVLLAYHPRENVVTASICNYTKEEIENEIWADNGPGQRDVPKEKEKKIEEERKKENDTAGKN